MGTQTHSTYLPNPANPLRIGQRGDNYGYWDGNLDEAAIYAAVLSPDRIQAHYQAGTNFFRAPTVPAFVRRDPASTTNYAGHTAQFRCVG